MRFNLQLKVVCKMSREVLAVEQPAALCSHLQSAAFQVMGVFQCSWSFPNHDSGYKQNQMTEIEKRSARTGCLRQLAAVL